ncbi:hypothetical protein ACIQXD_04295 [Streptomyces uncialis]|uniref:hypothetical protein n=1 Tax=Streptomyces uncialis TaxID=1048205 RepID=UPI0037FBFC71
MKAPSIKSVFATGLLLGCTAIAVPAQAQAAEKPGDHCVANLSTGSNECFGTFRESIAFATNGQVTDAPLTARAAVADKTLKAKLEGPQTAGANRAAAYALSIEYQLSGYGGATLTITANAPCVQDGQRDFTVNDIRDIDPWWNDRISSFQGYNTCDVNHYENQVVNGGDTTGPKASMSSMGAMDNKTTGLTFG